jgi:acetate kinase
LLDRGADDIGLVVAHLGSGCSVTAVVDGRSINTTMGMTPMEGLMMGTRSGSLDPAIVLLAQERGLSRRRVAAAIGHQAGLLGVSGRSADVRDLELAASQGDGRSALALEMFCARAAAGIAAMASSLDTLDAVAFTGGIGAGSHGVRRRVCARLAVLGVPVPNGDQPLGDGVIGQARGLTVLRVESREDLVIARQVFTAS